MAQSLFVQVVLSEKKKKCRLSSRLVTLCKGTDESEYRLRVISHVNPTIALPTHGASQ